MTSKAHYGRQCSIMAISFVTSYKRTTPITLLHETLGLLLFINTQRDTTLEIGDDYTCTPSDSWIILDHLLDLPLSS